MGPNSPTLCSLFPETILHICHILSLGSDGTEQSTQRSDLTSLALTCRFLNEPALDTLWHTLDTLAPLLCTLPQDLCTTAPFTYLATGGHESFTRTKLVFLRDPVQGDFERFFTYSKRVHKLGRERFPRDILTDDLLPSTDANEFMLVSYHRITHVVWKALSAFAPKPLLPNLQSLYHWERGAQPGATYYPTEFHPADMLFAPELREADLFFRSPYGDGDHATDVVRTLAGVAPALERLNVEVNSQLPCTWDAGFLHCTELRLFTRLTSFTGRTVCISPDALMALGSLPCLESLLVHIYPKKYSWDTLPHERRADFFPALQHLVLHKIGFEWCASFLRVFASASLRALSLRCEHHELPPPLLLEDLCTAISEHPSCGAITDLLITIGYTEFQPGHEDLGLSMTYWDGQYSESERYRSANIAPLFTTLFALRRLVVKGACVTIIDDAMLDTISQRCPDIVELALAWDPDVELRPDDERGPEDDDFPRVTPSGLLRLARHCPRLHTLALAVNMGWSPPSDSALLPAPPLHLLGLKAPQLRKFDVTGSLFCDGVYAASVLSLLFPRLCELSGRFAEEQEEVDVVELYRHLAQIRAQERACAARKGKRLREPDLGAGLERAFGVVEARPYETP